MVREFKGRFPRPVRVVVASVQDRGVRRKYALPGPCTGFSSQYLVAHRVLCVEVLRRCFFCLFRQGVFRKRSRQVAFSFVRRIGRFLQPWGDGPNAVLGRGLRFTTRRALVKSIRCHRDSSRVASRACRRWCRDRFLGRQFLGVSIVEKTRSSESPTPGGAGASTSRQQVCSSASSFLRGYFSAPSTVLSWAG